MLSPFEGLRVVRGPDWKWGDQDGGEGCVGTVVSNTDSQNRKLSSKLEEKLNTVRAEALEAGISPERIQEMEELAEKMAERVTGKIAGLREKIKPFDDLVGKLSNVSGAVAVAWDTGHVNKYRIGAEGAYDLRVRLRNSFRFFSFVLTL